MAMNATKVTLDVKGVNRTGKVFKEIATSAANVGRTVAMIGAAGIGAAAGAFALAARELGKLSDVAMQAGVSTDEITKLSTALNILGLRSNTPEQIATAFSKMAKSIGETGLPGFKRAIKAISELATVEERSAAAMAVFGKSGLDFMPIIEAAAKDGMSALEDVTNAMPGVSQAAADSGDKVADAFVLVTQGAKALWLEACGKIAGWMDTKFKGGVREAAMAGNAYMKYFAKAGVLNMQAFANGCVSIFNQMGSSWENVVIRMGEYLTRYFKALGGWIMDFVNVTWDDIKEKGLFGRANENFQRAMETATDKLWKGIDLKEFVPDLSGIRKELALELEAAAKAAGSVGSAAVGFAATDAADETAEKIQKAMKAVRNELVSGGTYKAATLSMRADYAKGEDKTVKSVNAVKSVVEKINSTNSKIAAALAGGIGET